MVVVIYETQSSYSSKKCGNVCFPENENGNILFFKTKLPFSHIYE